MTIHPIFAGTVPYISPIPDVLTFLQNWLFVPFSFASWCYNKIFIVSYYVKIHVIAFLFSPFHNNIPIFYNLVWFIIGGDGIQWWLWGLPTHSRCICDALSAPMHKITEVFSSVCYKMSQKCTCSFNEDLQCQFKFLKKDKAAADNSQVIC